MLAASLASKMVYAEGVQYITNLSDEVLGEFACKYITQSDRIRSLVNDLEATDFAGKEEVIDILRHGGTRTALELV
jgi:glutamate dehydrogenase